MESRKYVAGYVSKHYIVIARATETECKKEGKNYRLCYYKCKCKHCGKELLVSCGNIEKGNGCECQHKLKDISGNKYGRLTVLRRLNKEECKEKGYNGRGVALYECLCDCGNTTFVRSTHLEHRKNISCGCYNKERNSGKKPSNWLNIEGKRFGKLVAVRRLEPYEIKILKPNLKTKWTSYWVCQCDCGNKTLVSTNCLNSGSTQSCGCVKSKGEMKINEILKNSGHIVQRQYKLLQNKKTKQWLYADFFIDRTYIIEYDGEQHSIPVKRFGGKDGLNKTKERDRIKNEYCKKHNIPVIRIPYIHYKDLCIEDLQLETSKFLLTRA